MKTIYIVRAIWDDVAKVWVATSENFIGLATEAPTVEALLKKIPPMIEDLLEANDDLTNREIPLRLLVDSADIGQMGCAH